MDIWELKSFAEETFDDLMSDFWYNANTIAYEHIPTDLQREEFFSLLADLLSNYK